MIRSSDFSKITSKLRNEDNKNFWQMKLLNFEKSLSPLIEDEELSDNLSVSTVESPLPCFLKIRCGRTLKISDLVSFKSEEILDFRKQKFDEIRSLIYKDKFSGPQDSSMRSWGFTD